MMWEVGIDEAGRGPLAGPVAVGLVRIPTGFDLRDVFPRLNDSKKLSEKVREELFGLLEERVVLGDLSYAVVLRDASTIDAQGIAVVIRDAIAEGLSELLPEPGAATVMLDGALRAPALYTQETIIKGDSRIPSIMLASIAAKVTRDRYMETMAKEYPQYQFERHKGYGTKLHQELLRTHGLCAIHRRSFIHLDRSRTEE